MTKYDKELGVHYTSTEMADRLAEWALPPEGSDASVWKAWKVLDPAAGDGALLDAVKRRIESHLGEPMDVRNLIGYDIREEAVQVLRSKGYTAEHRNALDLGWAEVDSIIMNPPFLGGNNLGVSDVRKTYKHLWKDAGLHANADLGALFFYLASRHCARVAILGPNALYRSGRAKVVLQKMGGIVALIPDIPWDGEASVMVALARYVRGEKSVGMLREYRELHAPGTASFRKGTEPGHKGFRVGADDGPAMFREGTKPGHKAFRVDVLEAPYRADNVVIPHINGNDLVSRKPGDNMHGLINLWDVESEFELRTLCGGRYWDELAQVREDVLSGKSKVLDREKWWKTLVRPLPFSESPRLVRARVSSRNYVDVIAGHIDLNNKIYFCDDSNLYTFGIYQSDVHWQWALLMGGRLETRLSYSTKTICTTFPWPQNPTEEQVLAIAEASRELISLRNKLREDLDLSVRELYRAMPQELKDAHAALDRAVCSAYGFEHGSDYVEQLYALNQAGITGPQGLPTEHEHLRPSILPNEWTDLTGFHREPNSTP